MTKHFQQLKVLAILAASMMLAACDTAAQYGLTPPPPAPSKYKINFQLPANWKVASSEQDSDGYSRFYRPEDTLHAAVATESIFLNYGVGNTKPLSTSMQEIVQGFRPTGCHIDSKLLSEQKNSMIFRVNLSQCQTGRSADQIYKIFNTQDGHYELSYSANRAIVSAAEAKKMEQVVRSAQIVQQ